MAKKREDQVKREQDMITIECDGWRSWERIADDALDLDGVILRSGYAFVYLSLDNCGFHIDLTTDREKSEEIFKEIAQLSGVLKITWTSNAVIMREMKSNRLER